MFDWLKDTLGELDVKSMSVGIVIGAAITEVAYWLISEDSNEKKYKKEKEDKK